ncbi:MAG: hypothetical protein PHU46_17135 [Rhodocyclaceae bacterium]|nr:hypothetical protein [Rhodocyclaceae bacterium]
MTEQRRKALILGLLVLTLAAALWPLPDDEDSGRSKPRSALNAGKASGAPLSRQGEGMGNTATQGSPTGETAEVKDLFPVQTWAPKLVVPDKPAKPEPPPLPFVFAGRYQEEGQFMVFLTEGDGMYTVREGDSLPGGWKLTEIGPNTLTFIFSPLNITRSLPMSELRP